MAHLLEILILACFVLLRFGRPSLGDRVQYVYRALGAMDISSPSARNQTCRRKVIREQIKKLSSVLCFLLPIVNALMVFGLKSATTVSPQFDPETKQQ